MLIFICAVCFTCLQCEWVWFFISDVFYAVLTGECQNYGFFFQITWNCSISQSFLIISIATFGNAISLINHSIQLLVYCLSSICNWWYQEAWILLYLGRTVYKRLWACLALYHHYKFSYTILFLSPALNLTAKSVADPGFFRDHKVGLRTYYFAENCMKMKELGSRGARGVSLAPTLDPPLTVSDFLCPWHWLLIVFNVIWNYIVYKRLYWAVGITFYSIQ